MSATFYLNSNRLLYQKEPNFDWLKILLVLTLIIYTIIIKS